MPNFARAKALITGASGGMGRACARLFAATHDLVLTDASTGLGAFADELRSDGHSIVGAFTGDLGDEALLATLVGAMSGDLPPTLIHAAGLSPSMADWRAILAVNLVATVRLLDGIEPLLRPGSVAVLIASTAGHMMRPIPEVSALTADPLAPDFLDRIGELIERISAGSPAGAPGTGYVLSKQAVLALVERRSMSWGRLGARIVSISPGLILTPMGQKELAETNGAVQLAEMAPAGRAGTALDIALAARFLASAEASFITGCDLKVDGGATAAISAMAG